MNLLNGNSSFLLYVAGWECPAIVLKIKSKQLIGITNKRFIVNAGGAK
ncbi:hypothetical protein [Methanolacinia paynteri]|nr:hypothetical protein [Methanolacinia paynteri]